nr:NADH-quinone oxidoreductase subunit C [Candidatus Freyrarchaeum guaymaensis]
MSRRRKVSTKNEEKMLVELKKELGPQLIEGYVQRPRRIHIKVNPGAHRKAIEFMRDKWDVWHVSTITGIDLGEKIEVIFHMWKFKEPQTAILVRTEVPKSEPKLETVTDIVPASNFYEREVHDLLGVVFEGHPNLERIVLPDDWPEGVYPLRKDWQPPE